MGSGAPIAKLGPYPLLGSGPTRWTLRMGVEPVVATFDMAPDSARSALADALKPLTLKLESGERKEQFAGLYVLHAAPSEDPDIARVVVADRRWFWSRRRFLGRFNIRRRVGTRRQQNPEEPATAPVFDAVQYAPWSTRDNSGSPAGAWRPVEVLYRVLESCVAAEREVTGASPDFRVGSTEGLEAVPIEGLVLDAYAHEALRTALGYLPEMDVFVDEKGDIRVISKASGAEAGMVKSTREIVDAGHVEFVRHRRVRPSEIHVYFSRQCEVRFNAVGPDDTVTIDDRYMENVLPIPDYELVVDGDTLARGTWIPVSKALTAWGNVPGWNAPLTDEFLRQAALPFLDLFDALGQDAMGEGSADWMSRLSTLQQHWRKTYRVNRHWADRILRIYAHRVATIDPTTGTRAPAQMFSNYCIVSSARTRLIERRAGKEQSYARNVRGYPVGGKIGEDTHPAPARVSVVDPDQFIVRFDYLVDPNRTYEMVLPSMMELVGDSTTGDARPSRPGPTHDILDPIQPIGFDLLTESQQPATLTREHRIATIVTAEPAAPNDLRQLHRIVVRPDDVRGMVTSYVRKSLLDAAGPVLEIRISDAVETARTAWADAAAELIEAAFGIGGGQAETVDLSPWTVNEDSNESGASLNQIARAAAAAVWSALADRYVGSASGQLEQQIRPAGRLSEVTHEIRSDGVSVTSISLPGYVQPIDFLGFLPDGARRTLLGMVGAGRLAS